MNSLHFPKSLAFIQCMVRTMYWTVSLILVVFCRYHYVGLFSLTVFSLDLEAAAEVSVCLA